MRPGHIPRVEACDPSPAGGGEVDEDCTMASPVHVCRAVCEGVCLYLLIREGADSFIYNMPVTPTVSTDRYTCLVMCTVF